jgi:N-acetylglucosamine-6-phosphate deacetylase
MPKIFDAIHAAPVGARLVRQTTFSDGTKVITDALDAAAAPVKSVPLDVQRILASAGIKSLPAANKYRVAELDAAFTKAGMSVVNRLRAKAKLVEAGLLD